MATVSEEVTDVLSAWMAPRVVASPPLKPGGVDPLGLRQVNFDLMNDCIPGLNNTATRLRPYALVAWAWWRAAALARAAGGTVVEVDRLKAFVDRIEVVFAVGHLVARDFDGLLGSDTLAAEVVARGAYDFSSRRWRTFRERRSSVTSLMAPVSYGPSAKEGAGLGYLSPRGDGAFAPTTEAMPAVMAFDRSLAGILDDPSLASLDCGEVDVGRMVELHAHWSMDRLTPEERAVGSSRIARGDRARTLSLALAELENAGSPLRVDELRWRMASADVRSVLPGEPPGPASCWRALQAQQLHRLSLEALLVWLLDVATSRPRGLRDLAAMLVEVAELGDGATFGDWLDDPELNDDGVADPVGALERIAAARQRDRPDLALEGVRVALATCRAMGADPRLFGGSPDRLPLRRALARSSAMAALSVMDGFEALLSEWVIGQHLYWAIGRSGDDTQRLRLMLDEGGWLSFASYADANPTPDRLATLLSLAADAGLVEKRIVEDRFVFLAR